MRRSIAQNPVGLGGVLKIGGILRSAWDTFGQAGGDGTHRNVTSYPSIKTDVTNAGAKWEDSEVVMSNGIIPSRNPNDLEAFVSKVIEGGRRRSPQA